MNQRLRNKLFFVGFFSISLFVPFKLSFAASPIFITPNEPYTVRFSLPNGDEPYNVKLRIKDTSTGDYSGETWNGTEWLNQNDSWANFPSYPAGTTQIVTGQVGELVTTQVLQVAIRKVGGTSVSVVQEIPISQFKGSASAQLSGYDPISGKRFTQGYFSVTEGGSTRLLALLEQPTITTTLQTNQAVVSFYLLNGQHVTTHNFSLLPGTIYKLTLNPPLPVTYSAVLDGPVHIHPFEPVTFALTTTPHYTGTVEWFKNGIKVNTTSSATYTTTFSAAGTATIEAVLTDNDQTASKTIEIASYKNISIKKVLPNPEGRDTQTEKIILANNNPFSVELISWKLKSRTTSTSIPISGSIQPNGELIITTSNKIVNQKGMYDLYNESNALVDTLFYDTTIEGTYLIREGLLWQSEQTNERKNTDSISTGEKITITGVIKKPSGRTIDLITDKGEVRVVVHKSFDRERPRLHTGDTLSISGIWQKSRRGPYISVRSGDTFTLISLAAKPSKRKAAKSPKIKPGLKVATAKASSSTLHVPKSSDEQAKLQLVPSRFLDPPEPVSPWIALGVTLGLVLMLAPRQPQREHV